MKCNQYEQFELGKISPGEFKRHLETCIFCREMQQQDEQLLSTAAALNQNRNIPDLWPEIEQRLKEVQKSSTVPFSVLQSPFLRIAALFLIGLSLTLYFYSKPKPQARPILSASALQDVEKKETEYISSIVRLEKVASVRMDDLDLNLALLYRDKLEIIDSQIEKCREALKDNPANSHIRRYLLAALNEKKNTLKEILK